MPDSATSPKTAANGDTSNSTTTRISVDQSPFKFLLYGVTYLLATPSEFSQNIVPQGDDGIRSFLNDAGIGGPAQDACVAFTKQVRGDTALRLTMEQLHDGLQSDFGSSFYAPTPCPNGKDCQAILRTMSALSSNNG